MSCWLCYAPILFLSLFYTGRFSRFLQRAVMSSKVLSFVSGTHFHTNSAAMRQMMPYKLYANIGLKSYNAGNVDETR